MEQVVTLCDLRCAALYEARPLHDHPRKSAFYLHLMAVPGLLNATVLRLAGEVISVEVNVIDQGHVIHDLLGRSPFHSQHSPGRYHLLHLCAQLTREEFSHLDLTPGGEYKADFGTGSEVAYLLHVFFSPLAGLKFKAAHVAGRVGRWLCVRFSRTPANVRREAIRLRHIPGTKVLLTSDYHMYQT